MGSSETRFTRLREDVFDVGVKRDLGHRSSKVVQRRLQSLVEAYCHFQCMLSRACSRRPSSPLSGITSRPAPRVLLLAVCCQWSAVCCLVAPRAAPGPTIIPCPHYLPGINDLPLPPNAPHHTAGVCAEHVQRPAGEPATHLLACRPQLMRLSNLRSPPADQTRPDQTRLSRAVCSPGPYRAALLRDVPVSY